MGDHLLRREPYRLFFPLGVMLGGVGVGHWLAYAAGWTEAYSGFLHASLMIGTYLTCFILGFLMTALPRFSGAVPASRLELAAVIALLAGQLLALGTRQWVAAELCLAGLWAFLLVFAGRRVIHRPAGAAAPPMEFLWIPVAAILGVTGAGLLVAAQQGWIPPRWLAMGRPLVQQGFVVGIVLGVGGFLAPRLMGHWTTPPPAAQSRRLIGHAAAAVLFVASFWWEGRGAVGPAYLLRAAVVTAELMATARLHRRPRLTEDYVQFLWLSLWLVVAGLWGAAAWPRWRVPWLHLMFLGGFSLMTFAVGTMVVLSHVGQPQRLRGASPVLRVVAAALAAAMAARVAAEMQPDRFFAWLGLAAACWLIGGLTWLAFAAPWLLRTAPAAEVERLHEAAKARILRVSACAHAERPA